MRTIVLENPGRLEQINTSLPDAVGPDQALVKVHQVGICGTDIHAYRGEQPYFDYPRILGHELGVEVVKVGANVTHVKPGDRCAVEPYVTCGQCPPCRRGRTNCCQSLKCLGVQTDGGMREQIVVTADKLHRSGKLHYEALALVETLSIGKHAVDRAQVKQSDRVAVLGLGPIGLTAATFAKLNGANVVGIDLSEQRTKTARSLLGIQTMDLDTNRPIHEQWDESSGELPLIVFDATGNRGSMQQAFRLPVNGGTLVFIGLVLGEISFDDPEFHRKELTLLSSRNSTGNDFKQIITMIEDDRIDVGLWVTHRCQAEDLPALFETWVDPTTCMLKGVVSF